MSLSSKDRVPKHIAVIPDGNRRWSRSHRLSLMSGYQIAFDKVTSFSFWAKSMGANTLTIWGLSTENIRSRSKAELRILYTLYRKFGTDPKILKFLTDNNASIRFIGNLRLVPAETRKALLSLQAKTRAYKELTINMLVGYGGRDDIMYAASRGATSEEAFSRKIRTSSIPEVDLVIRTSGEQRLSGFLPWQTDYSELYFCKKLWPDFSRRDLKRAIDSYGARERRFGK